MATSQPEKQAEIQWVDIIWTMNYVEEHYGGIPECHISTNEDDTRNALLCITCPRGCKLHPDAVGVAFTSREVPYSQLHRVLWVLHDMFYELIEELDGACPACLAAAAKLN